MVVVGGKFWSNFGAGRKAASDLGSNQNSGAGRRSSGEMIFCTGEGGFAAVWSDIPVLEQTLCVKGGHAGIAVKDDEAYALGGSKMECFAILHSLVVFDISSKFRRPYQVHLRLNAQPGNAPVNGIFLGTIVQFLQRQTLATYLGLCVSKLPIYTTKHQPPAGLHLLWI